MTSLTLLSKLETPFPDAPVGIPAAAGLFNPSDRKPYKLYGLITAFPAPSMDVPCSLVLSLNMKRLFLYSGC